MPTIPYNSSQKRPIGQSTNYPSISSSSSSFNYNNYYNTLTGTFTPYESTLLPSPSPSPSSNLLNTNSDTTTISTLLQSQGAYVGPTHNLLMFGGDQPAAPSSCSSSDGSCNNNNNQVIITNVDGFYGDISPLEYSIEEINQLISTSNICHNLDYFVEENKREEQGTVMYYWRLLLSVKLQRFQRVVHWFFVLSRFTFRLSVQFEFCFSLMETLSWHYFV